MARISEATARLGRVATQQRNTQNQTNSGDFPITTMRFEAGETKRIVIPKLKFDDGTEGVFILGEPIHRVLSPGFLQKTSKAGKKYNLYEIRCMNPKRQFGDNVTKFAEGKQHCVYCELARLESRRRNQLVNEEYTTNGDAFNAMTKDEQRAFYQGIDAKNQIESSYLNNRRETNKVQYIVGLEIETQEETKPSPSGLMKTVVTPIKGEDGLPKYKLVYIKASEKMLTSLQTEATQAFNTEALGDDYFYGYNVSDSEQVQYPFVDFQFIYPAGSRKDSAKNRAIRATIQKYSVVTPEFVKTIQAKSAEIIKLAEDNFYRAINTLAPLETTEEQISLMADGGKYYREMVAEYGITEDNRPEPTLREDGTYDVVLTDEELDDIGFRSVTEGKTSSAINLELKQKVLADKGIQGEVYVHTYNNTKDDAKGEDAPKKVAKKATKTSDVKVDDFFG